MVTFASNTAPSGSQLLSSQIWTCCVSAFSWLVQVQLTIEELPMKPHVCRNEGLKDLFCVIKVRHHCRRYSFLFARLCKPQHWGLK